MASHSRVIINTGDGKGKTTAALGTVLRAVGHGQRVAIVQFLKGKWTNGEVKALAAFPDVFMARMGSGFTWEKQDLEEDRILARRAWDLCAELMRSGRYDLLVMDELNVALDLGLLPVEEVVNAVRDRPPGLSVIITGRAAKPELIDLADTVTEMREIKHAFRTGTRAHKGIEY
jgi:cob(I)alamin adenosyltransferase